MNKLDLIANVCGAVGMFGLGLKIRDKIGRITCFVLAGLSALVVAAHLLGYR